MPRRSSVSISRPGRPRPRLITTVALERRTAHRRTIEPALRWRPSLGRHAPLASGFPLYSTPPAPYFENAANGPSRRGGEGIVRQAATAPRPLFASHHPARRRVALVASALGSSTGPPPPAARGLEGQAKSSPWSVVRPFDCPSLLGSSHFRSLVRQARPGPQIRFLLRTAPIALTALPAESETTGFAKCLATTNLH